MLKLIDCTEPSHRDHDQQLNQREPANWSPQAARLKGAVALVPQACFV
jgi:hypothetical protein